MRAITKLVQVYSNEIMVRDHAALQTLLEEISVELENLTECEHTTLFYEDCGDIDEETVDTYFYMLDGYCIGSLVIAYTPNYPPEPKPATIEVCFTITYGEEPINPNIPTLSQDVQDTFNPIFLNAEK